MANAKKTILNAEGKQLEIIENETQLITTNSQIIVIKTVMPGNESYWGHPVGNTENECLYQAEEILAINNTPVPLVEKSTKEPPSPSPKLEEKKNPLASMLKEKQDFNRRSNEMEEAMKEISRLNLGNSNRNKKKRRQEKPKEEAPKSVAENPDKDQIALLKTLVKLGAEKLIDNLFNS